MTPIRTLLVDDEFLALQLVEKLLQPVPSVQVVGKCRSALEARDFLTSHDIDLLFLDIQMPALSGINFLRQLPDPPVAIFTTAYSEFAAQAFELNAVDYLLKPFTPERLRQALQKAEEQLLLRRIKTGQEENPPGCLVVRADGMYRKIPFQDIVFIEGMKEYVRIHCRDARLVVLESMQNLENKLPSAQFMRIHKSYIAALQEVKSIRGFSLELRQGAVLPIGRPRRKEVLRAVFGKE